MRHLIVIFAAVVILVLMRVLKNHREKIMVGGIVVLSLISGVYCYANASSILPKRQPFSQTFYSSDYLEQGDYPDAFLRLYLEGKTVYVKNDRYTIEEAEDSGRNYVFACYHVDNVVNYLKSVYANVVEDESINDAVVPNDKAGNFECLGYLNDLLRNTVMYTTHTDHVGNYFMYLWYYRDLTDTCYMYVNTESLSEDELVLIWQNRINDNGEIEENETEDIFLMGKNYYEENFKK